MGTHQQRLHCLSSFLGDDGLEQVAALCRRYHVRQLAIFGSVLTPEFSGSSDLDVAVVFDRTSPDGSFEQFMGLKGSLEQLFDLEVDLVTADRVRNPVFARELRQAQEVIYAA
jgi:hypothetical protein